MGISRRSALIMLGSGSLGMLSGGFTLPFKKKRHLITLSFDDGFRKSSIKTAEIYEKYGLASCINVIANAQWRGSDLPDEYHRWPVGDFTLWNELKRRGHEIMPHGFRHANLGEMPLEEARDLVNSCIEVFNEELLGFSAGESVFNLPYNSSTPELEKWLQARFRAIRTHGDAVNPLPFKGQFRLGCTSYGPESIDKHLVETINHFLEGPSGWLIYNTHGLDDEGWGPLSASLLDELLDRLSTQEGVEVLPIIPALDSIQI
jgi:peptidoglycan/xylan/chitin deacetylase (PgdA/CDA1 family)